MKLIPRTALAMVVLALLGTTPNAGAHSTNCNKPPRLGGQTVTAARTLAGRAGCGVRLVGAPLKQPGVQTVRSQSRKGRTITLAVNPLCEGFPEHQPVVTPGPTMLVVALEGLHLERPSPHPRPRTTGVWSEPECHIIALPAPGTITVTDSSGQVVAIIPVAEGQIARVPLPAGHYTIVGTFANDHEEGEKPAHSFPTPVTIPQGKTVRQDVTPKGPNP
jgi:hypothetical protein